MKNGRVLVVDDDSVVLTVIEAKLESEGLEVVTTTGAQEGFSKLIEGAGGNPFDLLITDLCMPGERGTVLIKSVRDSEQVEGKKDRLPIILLTSADPEDIPTLEQDDLMRSDIAYLEKASVGSRLVPLVRKILARSG